MFEQNHPAIYQILTEIQDVGLDSVEVELVGAIFNSNVLETGNVKGFPVYFTSPEDWVKSTGGSKEPPLAKYSDRYVTDISEAESRFVQEHKVPEQVYKFLVGSSNEIPNKTFVWLGGAKRYVVESGGNTNYVYGFEKMKVINVVTFVPRPELKNTDVKTALMDSILYNGTAVNLFKIEGTMPYATIYMNYNTLDHMNRTIIYRTPTNDLPLPRGVRQVNRLALGLPGARNIMYYVNDEYEDVEKAVVKGGSILLVGYTDVITNLITNTEAGAEYFKDGVIYQSDIIPPSKPVKFNVDMRYKVYVDHPMAFESEPSLYFELTYDDTLKVDIDPIKFYSEVVAVLAHKSEVKKSVDITPAKGAEQSKSKWTLEVDYKHIDRIKYEFYIQATASTKKRMYNGVLLDWGASFSLPVLLEVGTYSRNILQKKIEKDGRGHNIEVIETANETMKRIWNFRMEFYTDRNTGFVWVFMPEVGIIVDPIKKKVTLSVSGMPPQYLYGFHIMPQHPAYKGTGYVVKTKGKPSVTVPISCLELLPPAFSVTPMLSETAFTVEGTSAVTLDKPTVDVSYDDKNNEVVVKISDFKYCDRIKVRVVGMADSTWTVEKCIRNPRYLYGNCPGEIAPNDKVKVDGDFAICNKNACEYRFKITGKPAILVAEIYDCWGIYNKSIVLKQVAQAYKVKDKGVWIAYVPPGDAGAVVSKNSADLFKALVDAVNAVRGDLVDIQRYTAFLPSDVLADMLRAGAPLSFVANYDPNKHDLTTYLNSQKFTPSGETSEVTLYEWLAENYPGFELDAFREAYAMYNILKKVFENLKGTDLYVDLSNPKDSDKGTIEFLGDLLFYASADAPYLSKMLLAVPDDVWSSMSAFGNNVEITPGPTLKGAVDTQVGFIIGASSYEEVKPEDVGEEFEDGEDYTETCYCTKYIWPALELTEYSLPIGIDTLEMIRNILQKYGVGIVGFLGLLALMTRKK